MDSPDPARKAAAIRVFLPSAAERGSGAGDPLPVSTHEERVRLLVVEDEVLVRNLTCATLESAGFEVLAAADGSGALEWARQGSGALHLLVTDVMLPGMSGREVAERVRRLHPRIRVLYVSGYTDESIAGESGALGAVGFLQKPFTPDVLLRRVREMLRHPGAG